MNEWVFAQTDPGQQLARLHFFSMMKPSPAGEVEIVITIKEFAEPKDGAMAFFAQAGTPTNQGAAAPYTACGWGDTLFTALAQCVREVDRFPLQAKEHGSGGGAAV